MKSIAGIPLKTLFFILFLISIVALLIYFASLSSKAPTIKTAEHPNQEARTVLTFSSSPNLISTPSGTFYSEDILIDTKGNKIDSVQLEISYDSDVINIIDILPSDFFDSPLISLKTIDDQNGRVSFAFSSASDRISGSAVITRVNFITAPNIKSASQTALTFLPKTQVNSRDTLNSLLRKADPQNILVNPLPKPTPTKTIFRGTGSGMLN